MVLENLVNESKNKYSGKVKFFCKKKGYGFIISENINEDIFFHFTSMNNKQEEFFLKPELRLIFDIHKGPRGLHAKNIMFIKDKRCTIDIETQYKKFIYFLGDIINEEIKNKKNNNKI